VTEARVVINHAAECKVFTVSCNTPVPAVTDTVVGRRRHQRRRGHFATTVGKEREQLLSRPLLRLLYGDIGFVYPACL
jgi:hypothetical protein